MADCCNNVQLEPSLKVNSLQDLKNRVQNEQF